MAFDLDSEEQPSGSGVSAGMARTCFASSKGGSTQRCSPPLPFSHGEPAEGRKVSGTTFTTKLGRERSASYFTQSNS